MGGKGKGGDGSEGERRGGEGRGKLSPPFSNSWIRPCVTVHPESWRPSFTGDGRVREWWVVTGDWWVLAVRSVVTDRTVKTASAYWTTVTTVRHEKSIVVQCFTAWRTITTTSAYRASVTSHDGPSRSRSDQSEFCVHLLLYCNIILVGQGVCFTCCRRSRQWGTVLRFSLPDARGTERERELWSQEQLFFTMTLWFHHNCRWIITVNYHVTSFMTHSLRNLFRVGRRDI